MSAEVTRVMKTVREGATAWIDEHQVTQDAADQLFRYIEAALDWQHESDAADAAV